MHPQVSTGFRVLLGGHDRLVRLWLTDGDSLQKEGWLWALSSQHAGGWAGGPGGGDVLVWDPRATIVGGKHWSLWAFVNSHNRQWGNYFLAAWERLPSTINTCALPAADSTWFSDQGRVRTNTYAPKNEQYKETLSGANHCMEDVVYRMDVLSCGVGEDSWESLGQQRDKTSQS